MYNKKVKKKKGIDSEMKLKEPLAVIYQSAEDGLADTVKPWLEAAGADCENISVIDESIKSLSMIDERLEEAIIRTKAKLLILDPIQAYLGGGMDMNRANEVLGGIAPKANKLEQAKRLLREVAETNNAMQSNEIFNLSEEQSISRWTLENAKKELGIRARRINNSWYWELDKIKLE